MSAQSNAEWGALAAYSDEMAEVWDRFARLPDPGQNAALDALCEAKGISIAALLRLGARLTESDGTVLAFAFEGGIKYRDMITGRRWSYLGSKWPALKIVPAQESHDRQTVIVAEGETDAARLTVLYPGADVAVMPGGARYFPAAYAQQLAPYRQVLIGLDNDEAGSAGAALIAEHVPHARRFEPPDANDWCELDSEPPPLPPVADAPEHCGSLIFTDLGPAYRGDIPAPAVIVDDLLYEEGVHSLAGHPDSGKSILAQYAASVVMRDGRHVVWLDYEQGPRMTGQRLREMGVPQEHVRELFHYAFCADDAVTQVAAVADRWPGALVVFDSLSKVLAAAGKDEYSNPDVTAWTGPLITATKTLHLPVLIIDHVTKDDKQGRYSRGAGAKLADVDVQWRADVLDEFSRDTAGLVRLTRAKDKDGYLPLSNHFRIGGGQDQLIIEPTEPPDDGSGPARTQNELVDAITAAGQLRTAEIAERVGLDPGSTAFKGPLKKALDTGRVHLVKRGVYAPATESEDQSI